LLELRHRLAADVPAGQVEVYADLLDLLVAGRVSGRGEGRE
jgi:hypothetical protein